MIIRLVGFICALVALVIGGVVVSANAQAHTQREAAKEVRARIFKQVMADFADVRDCVAQEEGAAMQGIGHTFFEELVYDNGQLVNPNLVDYRVPTFDEIPEEFHTVLVENGDGPGPFGVRGMAEGGILSVAPSVCNAIDRATGVRIRDLPLTPERVWRALKDSTK